MNNLGRNTFLFYGHDPEELVFVGYNTIWIRDMMVYMKDEPYKVTVVSPEELYASDQSRWRNSMFANTVWRDFNQRKQISTFLKDNNLPKFSSVRPTALTYDAVIEPGCAISDYCLVGIGSTLGEDSFMSPYAGIAHNAQVGKSVYIGGRATFGGSVVTGDYCYFGMCSVVVDNVSVAGGSFIGASTTVSKTLTEPGLYYGPAARKLSSQTVFDEVSFDTQP